MRGSFIALRRRFNQKPLFQSPLRSATAIHQTSSSSSFSPQWVVPLCCCEIDPICRLQRSPWCGISTRLEVLIILRARVWHYALWIQHWEGTADLLVIIKEGMAGCLGMCILNNIFHFWKKTTENTVFQVLLGAPDLMRGAMNFRGLKISRLINHNQLGWNPKPSPALRSAFLGASCAGEASDFGHLARWMDRGSPSGGYLKNHELPMFTAQWRKRDLGVPLCLRLPIVQIVMDNPWKCWWVCKHCWTWPCECLSVSRDHCYPLVMLASNWSQSKWAPTGNLTLWWTIPNLNLATTCEIPLPYLIIIHINPKFPDTLW